MSEQRRLTMLDERRPALETCAYCPKLSRSACPISDAEASETVTPWGKISATFDVAREATPATPEHAALAWACSGCLNCRELCELKNPVAETLIAARHAYRERGFAPAASERVVENTPRRMERSGKRIRALRERYRHRDDAPTAVLLGCEYVLKLDRETDDALVALSRLFGSLRLLSGCCGLPLETAGDPERADGLRDMLLAQARSAKRLIAVDAGCAFRLRGHAEPFAQAVVPRLELQRLEAAPARKLRYHDPCLLGRGLGVYDAPRRIVDRASAGGLEEFSHRRERAQCSGAGALVPLTRPETSQAIARHRVAEHERLGGGTIVTGCGGSLRNLRAAGADVLDLVSVVRALLEP